MFIRVIRLTLLIPGAQTIKDKRQVLQSLMTKLRAKFNISLAESGYQDLWQRSELGIAIVGCTQSYLDGVQQELIEMIEDNYPVEITDTTIADY
ncbi:MAG TPA: DUF503 domain-containing protein [Bacillota bacterium]